MMACSVEAVAAYYGLAIGTWVLVLVAVAAVWRWYL